MKELEKIFRRTLDDKKVTTSEHRALIKVLGEYGLTKRKVDLLRSKIFEMARNEISGVKNAKILEWLRGTTKAINNVAFNTPQSRNEVYFSPGEDCLNSILAELGNAYSTIDICVFTISDNRIANKIEYCYHKGVKIRIITDDDKTFDKGSDIEKLSRAGLNVRIDRTRHHMHHKFAIIDNKTIITGSYNWTRSAEQYNHENVLVTNDKIVTAKYIKEFDELWKIMKKY